MEIARICPHHNISQPAQDCSWFQYRRLCFVTRASEMSPNFKQPDAVTTTVYEPLQASNIIPMDEEGWGLQVGHEGVRLNLKDQYVWSFGEMAY